jgi:hypothetical protein
VKEFNEISQKYAKEILESRKKMKVKEHIALMKEPLVKMEFDELRREAPKGLLLSLLPLFPSFLSPSL